MSEQPAPELRRPDAYAGGGRRGVPMPAYMGGFLLLAVAVVSSFILVMGHIGALSVPGCGHDSACAEAAASAWGRVPLIGWPTSFLGFAYFAGALVAWALSRGGLSRWFMAIVRLGALSSLLFVAVIVLDDYSCGYCLASHAGNFGFWILAERHRRPAAPSWRPAGALVLCFVAVSAVLAVTKWREMAAVEERGEAARSESVARIIAAANDPAGAAPQAVHGDPVSAAAPPASEPAAGPAAGPAPTVTEAARPEELQPEARREPPPAGGGFRGRYLHGPDPAPIRIVMFTDYQCIDCNRIEEDARRILAARQDVSLSIKHFPMSSGCNKHVERNMHPNACWAARAAEAAGLLAGNDGFWKMHWWLFDHDGAFTDQELTAGLQELGFDRAEFIRVMTGPETLARVEADIDEALSVGIHYTPMIFVNGIELKGFNVRGALERTVAEVARENPPARTHTADRPVAAAQKFIDDWREGAARALPADAHPRLLGRADAPVEIVVWGDLVEPGTARADSSIRAFVAGRGDVRYNFRHFPVNQACNPVAPRTLFEKACLAARAAEAALLVGGPEAYWRLHAWLAQERERVDESALRAAARAQGLDPDALVAAMERPEVAAAIEEDCRAGQQTGLASIPHIFIDRRFVPRWERDGESMVGRMVEVAARGGP